MPEFLQTAVAEWTIRGVGWVGAAMVLIAFLLVGRKIISPDSQSSAILNLVGALLLTVNTMYFTAFASCALNIIWALIAGWNLASYARKARSSAGKQS